MRPWGGSRWVSTQVGGRRRQKEADRGKKREKGHDDPRGARLGPCSRPRIGGKHGGPMGSRGGAGGTKGEIGTEHSRNWDVGSRVEGRGFPTGEGWDFGKEAGLGVAKD